SSYPSSTSSGLQDFWSQRNNLHEFLAAQLASHGPENAGADRRQLVVEQHGGVVIELDEAAILAANAFFGAHHHRVHHLAFLHLAAGNCFLDGHLDDISDTGVTAMRTAQHLDAHDTASATVIRHVQIGLRLNHCSAPKPLLPSAIKLTLPFRSLPPATRTWSWTGDASPESPPGRQCHTDWIRRGP